MVPVIDVENLCKSYTRRVKLPGLAGALRAFQAPGFGESRLDVAIPADAASQWDGLPAEFPDPAGHGVEPIEPPGRQGHVRTAPGEFDREGGYDRHGRMTPVHAPGPRAGAGGPNRPTDRHAPPRRAPVRTPRSSSPAPPARGRPGQRR